MERTDITPPHHPNYGVQLDEETITTILKHSVPGITASPAIARLPHGKSFNNRIYTIQTKGDNSRSYVLKVNGRHFGAAKVENEVSCLLLLNHYCPTLPVPKAISWSTGGSGITRRNSAGNIVTVNGTLCSELPGWILMTQMPGSTVDAATLSFESKAELAKQVAESVASWRENIPRSSSSANLHLNSYSPETAEHSLYRAGSAFGEQIHVYGFAGYGNDSCPPVNSLLDYYRTELNFAVERLSTDAVLNEHREALLSQLRHFIDQVLPGLPIFQNNDGKGVFQFVHSDLFPRNIMVEGNPPKLTGIVDFEFSGFHPPMEEFQQEWLPDDDGSSWPPDMYQMLLDELGRHRQQTPRSLSSDEWSQVKKLAALRNFIAPWWIGIGSLKGQEIARQLIDARNEVEAAIEGLAGLLTIQSVRN